MGGVRRWGGSCAAHVAPGGRRASPPARVPMEPVPLRPLHWLGQAERNQKARGCCRACGPPPSHPDPPPHPTHTKGARGAARRGGAPSIFSGLPVFGLRPSRASRYLESNVPKPTSDTLSPFATLSTITSSAEASTDAAIFLETPARSAIPSTSSPLETAMSGGPRDRASASALPLLLLRPRPRVRACQQRAQKRCWRIGQAGGASGCGGGHGAARGARLLNGVTAGAGGRAQPARSPCT